MFCTGLPISARIVTASGDAGSRIATRGALGLAFEYTPRIREGAWRQNRSSRRFPPEDCTTHACDGDYGSQDRASPIVLITSPWSSEFVHRRPSHSGTASRSRYESIVAERSSPGRIVGKRNLYVFGQVRNSPLCRSFADSCFLRDFAP